MPPVNSPAAKPRLASLDALRGFDMLWLVGGGPLLLKLCEWLAPESVTAVVRLQTSHAPYGAGPLRAHDLVMPLFLFMAGVAMAFSGPWADDAARPEARRWLKVLRRTGILWLLGMAVQGNLFSYDPARFIFYSNTLQAIAAGGMIAELVALLPAGRARLAAFVALPLTYWALTAVLGGGYAQDTNPALALDDRLMGHARGDRDYAWILPSLNFGFTVITGVYAGRWLRSTAAPLRKTALLAGAGAASLALSAALAPWEPVNKQLWTGTFCLWSGGWSLLLLAGFYGVVDGLGWVRWTYPLRVLGTNALLAYLLAELFSLRGFAEVVFGQSETKLSPAAYAVLMEAGTLGVLGLVLVVMYRHRIFVKF